MSTPYGATEYQYCFSPYKPLVAGMVVAMFDGAFNHGMRWLDPFLTILIIGALWLPMQALFATGFLALLIKGRPPIA